MTHQAIQKKVHSVIEGIAGEIYQAQQAIYLFMKIAGHVDPIKKRNFGNLFFTVQNYCIIIAILSLSKIFEKPRGNEIHSLPWLIAYLEKNKEIARAFPDVANFDVELKRWRSKIDEGIAKSAEALAKLKSVRDKIVAHAEIQPEGPRGPSWDGADELMDTAKDLLADIGFILCRIVYRSDDGKFGLDYHAMKAATALNRLFKVVFEDSRIPR